MTPQYAGKVWGIYDKKRGEELLFANRAHQPANIGALKSWAAGGAEWVRPRSLPPTSSPPALSYFIPSIRDTTTTTTIFASSPLFNFTLLQIPSFFLSPSPPTAHPLFSNFSELEPRHHRALCLLRDTGAPGEGGNEPGAHAQGIRVRPLQRHRLAGKFTHTAPLHH